MTLYPFLSNLIRFCYLLIQLILVVDLIYLITKEYLPISIIWNQNPVEKSWNSLSKDYSDWNTVDMIPQVLPHFSQILFRL